MGTAFRSRTPVLFVGDVLFFTGALWLSLFFRSLEVPSQALFLAHLEPFSLLFVAWVGVFFIAGLYESRSILLERRTISATLLVAQVINVVIAALFFFFIPIFGIAPKTILVIYLIVSFFLVLLWRVVFFPIFGLQKTENALVVGKSSEINELVGVLRAARHAPAHIAAVIEPTAGITEALQAAVDRYHPRFIIADFNATEISAVIPSLYNYLSKGVRFFDAMTLYEEVFGRVPLSVIDERWVLRNVFRYSYTLYDSFKRAMDIVIALPAAVISLLFYPFIAAAIKLQDGGPVFIMQKRVGEDNVMVRIYKFRSMSRNEIDLMKGMEQNRITPVGKFLRLTRMDELPQLWSVVRGELSFIGPRPELPSGVAFYEKEIPYYDVRHLVRPGLSGWAQLYHDNHPHHEAEVEATREKLSYDLYYVKHRSLLLDVTIALKTVKKLLTRTGI